MAYIKNIKLLNLGKKITQQNSQQKFISLKKIEQNLMVLTNALCVLAALHLAQVIGGMEINI